MSERFNWLNTTGRPSTRSVSEEQRAPFPPIIVPHFFELARIGQREHDEACACLAAISAHHPTYPPPSQYRCSEHGLLSYAAMADSF